MFLRDNLKISLDRDLTVGSGPTAVTYPADSLRNAGLRASLGITEVPDPVRPDDRMFFVTENPDGTYSSTPRPRDQVTTPILDRVKAHRDTLKAGGVKANGKWYHSDDSSRIQFMAFMLMGSSMPINIQWKTMDGSFAPLDISLVTTIFQQIVNLDIQAFTRSEIHRQSILLSDDPLNYDFTTGWPEVYATRSATTQGD